MQIEAKKTDAFKDHEYLIQNEDNRFRQGADKNNNSLGVVVGEAKAIINKKPVSVSLEALPN